MQPETREKISKAIISFIMVLLLAPLHSQQRSEIIFEAMRQEGERSLKELKVEDIPPPFYISYGMIEREKIEVTASLGSLINSIKSPLQREVWVRPLIGDYHKSHLLSFVPTPQSSPLSQEVELNNLRRELWILTDNSYKEAASDYRQKRSYKKRESEVYDFTPLLPIDRREIKENRIELKSSVWESYAMELSSLLLDYPSLSLSEVNCRAANTTYYYYNSEGSTYKTTTPLYNITIKLSLKDNQGGYYSDKLEYVGASLEQLPKLESVREEVEGVVKRLKELSSAPPVEEYYSGPVLFTGRAAMKLFIDNLFLKSKEGLVARREVINLKSGAAKGAKVDRSFTKRIGKRVIDQKFTIKDLSALSAYRGKAIPGYIDIDADGVKKEEEIMLIERGILKQMLCSRMVVDSLFWPTGSLRYNPLEENSFSMLPTLIKIEGEKGLSAKQLKKELLKYASGEGLEYAYMIKSLPAGKWPSSVELYRVNVKNGAEEMVKDASILTIFNSSTLRRVLNFAAKEQIISTMIDGFPVTICMPEAIILEEVELSPLIVE